MSAASPVIYRLEADGVGWIVFDAPNSPANVFNEATLAAFEDALKAAEANRPRAIVVTSAKDRIFVAGADLRWVGSLPTEEAAAEFSRRGQRLMRRLHDLGIPVVAAIHGACAGGGYELALACHWRIGSDAAVTQVGLPEVGLGTIPGWGGTLRLPRIIGAKAAVEHLLKAQLLAAPEALRVGLLDEIAPAHELPARARAAALRLAVDGIPRRPEVPVVDPQFLVIARQATAAKPGPTQAAALAAIDVMAQSAGLPEEQALELEARAFGRVTATETCRNLIHAFFLRDAARKRTLKGWFSPGVTTPRPITCVGVVGAGIMGSGIAHWLVTRGYPVVMRDVQPAALEHGVGVVRKLLDEAVKRGRMSPADSAAAAARVVSTTRWDGFERCGLVIEAIVENAAVKRTLFSELAAVVGPDVLLASNTSALPIEEIAGHVPSPQRTLGIHFFNPVSRMALVELIVGRDTSAETAESALALVKSLGKSPVICRSSPGFLVTRVLFFYLNEAVRRWEQGADTAEMDAALRDFGWPMGPLRLIDEVGIDVTDFIFSELQHYFPQRFIATKACGRLLAAGLKGRKNGTSRGFYRYEGAETVNDRETIPLTPERVVAGHGRPAQDRSAFADELMQVMVSEARRCLDEGVVKSPDDVDFALLSGTGFPAFRGGLMRWAAGRD
jgi:3-hydroxyacyl-CoA dehydrogenase/enoyl-CoA hydratase/3-hydroxybutyryl-CoA epimerase